MGGVSLKALHARLGKASFHQPARLAVLPSLDLEFDARRAEFFRSVDDGDAARRLGQKEDLVRRQRFHDGLGAAAGGDLPPSARQPLVAALEAECGPDRLRRVVAYRIARGGRRLQRLGLERVEEIGCAGLGIHVEPLAERGHRGIDRLVRPGIDRGDVLGALIAQKAFQSCAFGVLQVLNGGFSSNVMVQDFWRCVSTPAKGSSNVSSVGQRNDVSGARSVKVASFTQSVCVPPHARDVPEWASELRA